MLKIRPQHMNALAAQQAQGFVRRMMIHLREIFLEEVVSLDDKKLKAFVERVCAKGEEGGIVEEPHVERLIELSVSFDALRRDPLPGWISRMVRDPNRSADRLLNELEDELRFGEHS